MNCTDLASLLATNSVNSQRAAVEAHLAGCPACREFVAALESAPPAGFRVEPTFVPPDLEPVSPMPSLAQAALRSAGIVVALALLFAAMMGTRGWGLMTSVQTFAYGTFFGAALVTLITGFYAQFRPGSRSVDGRWALLSVAAGFAGLILILTPWPGEQTRFAWNAFACMSFGSAVSLAAATGILYEIRRGYALDQTAAGLWTGTLASIAGIAALQVYCFHTGAEHSLTGHLPVVLVSALAGVALVRSNLFRKT